MSSHHNSPDGAKQAASGPESTDLDVLKAARRFTFEHRAKSYYAHQGLTWHGNVIWVSSPLVVEIAQLLASFLICCPERRLASPELRNMLREWASHGLDGPVAETIADELVAALEAALRDARQPARKGPLYPRLEAPLLPVWDERIIARAVDGALDRCCSVDSAGRRFWMDAVRTVLPAGVSSPVIRSHDTFDATCWLFTHRDFVLVAERPVEVHREPLTPGECQATARLHCLDGPAISWPDGWSFYAVRGMEVPAWIIQQPERITVAAIETEQNAEWRRILIERYGWQRYIADCGAEVIDTVPMDYPVHGLRGARLLRKQLPGEPEPIVYLEVINSTPEPDGSQRRYLTRVNPRAYGGAAGRLCHAAMASLWYYRDDDGDLCPTFTRWEEYQPHAES